MNDNAYHCRVVRFDVPGGRIGQHRVQACFTNSRRTHTSDNGPTSLGQLQCIQAGAAAQIQCRSGFKAFKSLVQKVIDNRLRPRDSL